MQRVRMSLPYFAEFGWDAEVVTVAEEYVDMVKDPLLLQSVPQAIIIHKVAALSKKWTSKFGLGSIALRSLWFYRKKVNQLLRQKKYDLIYFSTTQFPVCILGAYWQNKFGIPYVIDMQDPWHSDFYKDKPKAERPKKYWISYRLNKFLEPLAMKSVNGLISVSANYIQTLQQRYSHLKNKPCEVITFGAFDLDFKIAEQNKEQLQLVYPKKANQIHLVYIGRGGYDMQQAVSVLLTGFKQGLEQDPALFEHVHFNFIGTSYAPKGQGIPTIFPIAEELGLAAHVIEHTDRIGFYQSIKNMQQADGLFIIGSNDSAYTASKLYPYMLAKKPLLGIFHPESSAGTILSTCNSGQLITLDQDATTAFETISKYLQNVKNKEIPATNWSAFEPYTASFLTKKQVEIFDMITH